MTRPLNFLHLTTFYPPYSFGGDGMYVYRLAHALADQGHQVDVIHCVDSYRLLHPAPPEAAFPGHPGVSVHGLRSGLGWLSPLLSHQTGRPYLKQKRIGEIAADKPYDVVHFHNVSLLGPGILRLRPGRGEAVKVYTTHEHWLICPTHVLWKFNRRPCERLQCIRCTLMAKRPPQYWRYTGLLEKCSREIDLFLAPSRFTAAIHAERGFAALFKHLPLFTARCDRDWQHPAPRPQLEPYFLFVGRLETIKGLQTLIEIWRRVRGADLLVAGTGTREAALRAMAAGNPAIKFLGVLPQAELGSLYFHALACVVPSLTYEPFPSVIIESFARKTPVIGCGLGAIPEIVGQSGGGIVYRDDGELLAALNRIASFPDLRSRLGERGYLAFAQRWTTEAHLELYFDLLRSTAEKKFGRVPWEADGAGRRAPAAMRE